MSHEYPHDDEPRMLVVIAIRAHAGLSPEERAELVADAIERHSHVRDRTLGSRPLEAPIIDLNGNRVGVAHVAELARQDGADAEFGVIPDSARLAIAEVVKR